jgi:hypothetical protein
MTGNDGSRAYVDDGSFDNAETARFSNYRPGPGFQEANDQRVMAGTYDRYQEVGDAVANGRYGDALGHVFYNASDSAQAAALGRSIPPPADRNLARIDEMLKSPIGATASLVARVLGGNQTWQDAALLGGSFTEQVSGGALGWQRTVAPEASRMGLQVQAWNGIGGGLPLGNAESLGASATRPVPRVDISDRFVKTPRGDGGFDFDFGNPTTHGLQATINKNGTLSMDIRANSKLAATEGSGTDMAASLMNRLASEGIEVNQFSAQWMKGSKEVSANYAYYNSMRYKVGDLDAARGTWTGKFFSNYGFDIVTPPVIVNSPGKTVLATFIRTPQ